MQQRVLEGCVVDESWMVVAWEHWGMPSVPDRANTESSVSSLKDGLCKVSCQGRVMTGHSHLSHRDCKIGYNQVRE